MKKLNNLDDFKSFLEKKMDGYDNIESNKVLDDLNSDMSEQEITDLLENDFKNHLAKYDLIYEKINFKELIKKGSDAITNWVLSSIKSLIDAGKKLKNNFIKIAKSITNVILKFASKHPKLIKIIIILIVIIIILAITAQASYGATDGVDMNTGIEQFINVVNASIGYLDNLQNNSDIDIKTVMEAKAYLVDLKDQYANGGADNIKIDDISQESTKLVKEAMSKMNELSSEDGDKFSNLVQKGEKFIKAFIDNSFGQSKIKIAVK